jgi:DNA mismatch endonuclease (patch repair protein)
MGDRFQKPDQKETEFGGLTRSLLMSRIRSSGNATTELRFLSLLRISRLSGWRRNYHLPGRPDFTFPKAKVVIFVDGCFWHGHSCNRRGRPKRNIEAWNHKFARNKTRDRVVTRQLRQMDWKVIRIWECTLSKNPASCLRRVARALNVAAQAVCKTESLG